MFLPHHRQHIPICKYLFDEWYLINSIKTIPDVHLNGNSVKITVTALVKVEESVVKDNPWNQVTIFKYLESYITATETSF